VNFIIKAMCKICTFQIVEKAYLDTLRDMKKKLKDRGAEE
jgi:hypothetical protein